jgi:uroporphyrinogen decarboxylase
MGDEQASRRDALECMDIGGKKGFILAPGCDLAMDTPKENLVAVSDLIHDEVLQGEIRASKASTENIQMLDLSNHWDESKVVIDVITLDSTSCAPCQYMYDAVVRAADTYGGKVIYKEHRIKEMEGVQMMSTLGVKNIPTIVIDGNVEFISQIPPITEIQSRIDHYLTSKN